MWIDRTVSVCPGCRRKLTPGGRLCGECDPKRDAEKSVVATKAAQPASGRRRRWPLPDATGVLVFIARLLIGGVAWIVSLGLAMASAIPYGGGDRGLLALFWLATLVIPIWVIAGLFKRNNDPETGSPESPDQRCPCCGRITPKYYQECIWCHQIINA
jgi:hypothetical protein